MTDHSNQFPKKVDLIDDGLLWLINRTVFHPRGYSLGTDETGDGFLLFGDGTEEWHYELGEAVEAQKFNAVRRVMP